MKLITAPELVLPSKMVTVFLAGSMQPWRTQLINELKDVDCRVINPTRMDMYSTRGQAEWSYDAIKQSNLVLVVFNQHTLCPETLLELGYALGCGTKSVLVYCPLEYALREVVETLCDRECVMTFQDYDNFVSEVKEYLNVDYNS